VNRRGKSRPTEIPSPDRKARSESLYFMSYASLLPTDKRNIKTKARMENGEMMQRETDRNTPRKTGTSAIFFTTSPTVIKTQEKKNAGGGGRVNERHCFLLLQTVTENLML